jgi:hypothetical protein
VNTRNAWCPRRTLVNSMKVIRVGHAEIGQPAENGHPETAIRRMDTPSGEWTPRNCGQQQRWTPIFSTARIASSVAGWTSQSGRLRWRGTLRDGSTFQTSLCYRSGTLPPAWLASAGWREFASLQRFRPALLKGRTTRRCYCVASHRAVAIPRSQHCPIAAAFSIRHSTAPIARLKSDFTANT